MEQIIVKYQLGRGKAHHFRMASVNYMVERVGPGVGVGWLRSGFL